MTDDWEELMKHYNVTASRNNPGESHENGSIEKSHDLLKTDVRQQLMLRGSSNFSSLEEYQQFVQQIIIRRNNARKIRFNEEASLLKPLPAKKYYAPELIELAVSKSSTIRIKKVTYSVPSRLIGYNLRAYIYQGEIKLYYGNQLIQTMKEVDVSQSDTSINYRHIINSLVRKPGAFENYCYRDSLFPSTYFRAAYDKLIKARPVNGTKEYLKILQQAAIGSESEIESAIEILIDQNIMPTVERIKELLDSSNKKKIVVVHVNKPIVSQYDSLLKQIA
jgi:hypothetical protein